MEFDAENSGLGGRAYDDGTAPLERVASSIDLSTANEQPTVESESERLENDYSCDEESSRTNSLGTDCVDMKEEGGELFEDSLNKSEDDSKCSNGEASTEIKQECKLDMENVDVVPADECQSSAAVCNDSAISGLAATEYQKYLIRPSKLKSSASRIYTPGSHPRDEVLSSSASSIIKLPDGRPPFRRKFSLMEKSRRAFAVKAMELKKKLPGSSISRRSLFSRRARGRPIGEARACQRLRRPWQLIELQLPEEAGSCDQQFPAVKLHNRPSEQLTLEYTQWTRSAAAASTHTHAVTLVGRRRCEPCSLYCFSQRPLDGGNGGGVRWILPNLQCLVCRCQFHDQCVQISRNSAAFDANNNNFICLDCYTVMESGGSFEDLGDRVTQPDMADSIGNTDAPNMASDLETAELSDTDAHVADFGDGGHCDALDTKAVSVASVKQSNYDSDVSMGHCVFATDGSHVDTMALECQERAPCLSPEADLSLTPEVSSCDIPPDFFSDGEFYGTPALFRADRPPYVTGTAGDADWHPLGGGRGRGRGRGRGVRGRPPLGRGLTARRAIASRLPRTPRLTLRGSMPGKRLTTASKRAAHGTSPANVLKKRESTGADQVDGQSCSDIVPSGVVVCDANPSKSICGAENCAETPSSSLPNNNDSAQYLESSSLCESNLASVKKRSWVST